MILHPCCQPDTADWVAFVQVRVLFSTHTARDRKSVSHCMHMSHMHQASHPASVVHVITQHPQPNMCSSAKILGRGAGHTPLCWFWQCCRGAEGWSSLQHRWLHAYDCVIPAAGLAIPNTLVRENDE